MTRLYANPGHAARMTGSAIVLVIVIIYGFFELWRSGAGGGSDTTGFLFGIFFVGGGAYGIRSFILPALDSAVALDADPATGHAELTLWRPFVARRIGLPLGALTDWRYHVKLGKRGAKSHFLLVKCPARARPVEFELRAGLALSEGLRALAPEAIADFEASTGVKA